MPAFTVFTSVLPALAMPPVAAVVPMMTMPCFRLVEGSLLLRAKRIVKGLQRRLGCLKLRQAVRKGISPSRASRSSAVGVVPSLC